LQFQSWRKRDKGDKSTVREDYDKESGPQNEKAVGKRSKGMKEIGLQGKENSRMDADVRRNRAMNATREELGNVGMRQVVSAKHLFAWGDYEDEGKSVLHTPV